MTRTAPGFEYAHFLARDQRSRLAQNFGVLEPDVGDDGDLAENDIGRIEPAAEADFNGRPFDAGLAEDEEGRGSEEIEPGRLGGGCAGAPGVFIDVKRLRQRARERRLVNLAALKRHPLGHRLDMGRSVAASLEAGARQRRFDQRRNRALPLGPRDMHGAKGLLRTPKALGEVLHRLEPDAHELAWPPLPVGQRVEPRHRFCELPILGHWRMLADKVDPAIAASRIGLGSKTNQPDRCRRIAPVSDRGLGRRKWADTKPSLAPLVRPLSRLFSPFARRALSARSGPLSR